MLGEQPSAPSLEEKHQSQSISAIIDPGISTDTFTASTRSMNSQPLPEDTRVPELTPLRSFSLS